MQIPTKNCKRVLGSLSINIKEEKELPPALCNIIVKFAYRAIIKAITAENQESGVTFINVNKTIARSRNPVRPIA